MGILDLSKSVFPERDARCPRQTENIVFDPAMKSDKATVIPFLKKRNSSETAQDSPGDGDREAEGAEGHGFGEGVSRQEREALLNAPAESDDRGVAVEDPELSALMRAKYRRLQASRRSGASLVGIAVILTVFVIGGYQLFEFVKSLYPKDRPSASGPIDVSLLPYGPPANDVFVIELEESSPQAGGIRQRARSESSAVGRKPEGDPRLLFGRNAPPPLGMAGLTATGTLTLNIIEERLKQNPQLKIEITGDVNIAGSRQFNHWYADQLAAGVKDYLMGRGIAANRMALREATAADEGIRNDETTGDRHRAEIKVRFFQ
jgi:hypothetical protein